MSDLAAGRLLPRDLLRLATVGLRTRKLRAALSVLGISIGIASLVAVLAISETSKADLLAKIERLGTNLLTVEPGTDADRREGRAAGGGAGDDRPDRPRSSGRRDRGASARRLPQPAGPVGPDRRDAVDAADLDLLRRRRHDRAHGPLPERATARYPVAVLGAQAAARLGIDRVFPGQRVWLGGTVQRGRDPRPPPLAPELDRRARRLPGREAPPGFDGHPDRGLRPRATAAVAAVQSRARRDRRPRAPGRSRGQPASDALEARAAAKARSPRSSSASARSPCWSAASGSRT